MRVHLLFLLFIVFYAVPYSQEKDTIFTLSGIEITATRKTTSPFNEPSAISIVSAKDFSKGKGYGLDEALSLVPGVFAQSRYGNQDIRLTIRGFGARGAGERSNSGTSRGIRILVDGFPETEPDGRTSFDNIDLSLMNRIEVVRSNSSALWGNAAGGLVSISSNSTFDRPFVALQSYAGGFGFQKNTFQLGTTLGTGKFFLDLSNTNSVGWRDHSSSTQSIANAGIVASLGEKTRLGVFLVGATNVFHIPGPLSRSQYDANPSQAQADTSYYKPTYIERDERRNNRLGRLGVSVTHSINSANDIAATAYVNPKYLQRSERNTFRDFNRYHVGGSLIYKNIMEIGERAKATTSIGIDEGYQDGAILFYQLKNGERDSILVDNKREGANSFGAFFQEEVALSDQLILSAGARYDNITYYAEDFVTPTDLSDQRSFTKVTPKAGIVYRFTPTHSIYASLGGGVEVPANNETDPAQGQPNSRSINPLLEPIVSTTVEIGTKQFMPIARSFARNISYDAALYLISTTNDIVPYQNGRFYLTAGKTQRLGAEIGATTQLEHGFSLIAAVTISSSKYVNYTIDSAYTVRPINLSLSGKTLSYKDNDVVGIPGYLVNLRLRNDIPFVEGLYAEVSLQSIGSYYADDANTLTVPSYTIFNATVGYAAALKFVDNLGVKAFATFHNVANKKYISSVYINPDFGRVGTTSNQAIYIEPGLPQYIVASLGLQYDF